jgi:hypothetical protein
MTCCTRPSERRCAEEGGGKRRNAQLRRARVAAAGARKRRAEGGGTAGNVCAHQGAQTLLPVWLVGARCARANRERDVEETPACRAHSLTRPNRTAAQLSKLPRGPMRDRCLLAGRATTRQARLRRGRPRCVRQAEPEAQMCAAANDCSQAHGRVAIVAAARARATAARCEEGARTRHARTRPLWWQAGRSAASRSAGSTGASPMQLPTALRCRMSALA